MDVDPTLLLTSWMASSNLLNGPVSQFPHLKMVVGRGLINTCKVLRISVSHYYYYYCSIMKIQVIWHDNHLPSSPSSPSFNVS